MGLIQDVEQKVETWILEKELPIAIRAGVSGVIGFLASSKIQSILSVAGVTIDPDKLAALLLKLASAGTVTMLAHLLSGWMTKKAVKPVPPQIQPVEPSKP